MMELFKLKVEKKNKLYFNKYKYKAYLYLKGANLTYYTSDIESFNQRYENLKSQYVIKPMSLTYDWIYEGVDVNKISKYLTWRNLFRDRVHLRVNTDSVSVFSNDLNLLKSLDGIGQVSITEVQALDQDVLYFKKRPKYKFRTYFRAKRVPKDFIENVSEFSKKHSNAKVSKSLRTFLISRNWHAYIYLHGSYYVDYNEESYLSILHMYFSGMIGKTYKCEKEPKN